MKNPMIFINDSGDGQSPSMYKLETTRNEMNDSKIKMSFYGNDLNWSDNFRGKTAAKLEDHGNGIKIRIKGGTIALGYDEVIEVLSLLRYYTEDSDVQQFSNHLVKLKEA